MPTDGPAAPVGLAFVGADEMRKLKREHLGVDEPTDVLSFPLDGREQLPAQHQRAPLIGKPFTADDLLRHVSMHKPDVAVLDVEVEVTTSTGNRVESLRIEAGRGAS